jgi:hypothetical protein
MAPPHDFLEEMSEAGARPPRRPSRAVRGWRRGREVAPEPCCGEVLELGGCGWGGCRKYDGGDGAADEGGAGGWFEQRRDNPRNVLEGGETFILQMRMQHLLDALQCGLLTYFADAAGFGDVAGDSLSAQHI